MSSELNKSKEELKPLTQQLYLFADAYYFASGRERTYKAAAIKAGANPKSAHTLGHRWANLPQVRAYWRELDESIGAQRRAMHMAALKRLEELAEDEELSKSERIAVNDKIIERTESAFDIIDAGGKGSTSDESTRQTIAQVLSSIQALLGGDGDD